MTKRFEIRIVAEERADALRLLDVQSSELAVNDNRPKLNDNELCSLNALISYKAAEYKITELYVERELCAYFDVADLKSMAAIVYDAAVRWLVDWKGGASI
jgi:hypothetical protein